MNVAKTSIHKNDISHRDVEAVNTLLQQLSSSPKTFVTPDEIQYFTQCGIFVTIRDTTQDIAPIIGMGTLTKITKLRHFCGVIDDVVVSEAYRGQGLGRKITEFLIQEAKHLNMDYIELTSKPERVEANALYQSIGFQKRTTNVYRLPLSSFS